MYNVHLHIKKTNEKKKKEIEEHNKEKSLEKRKSKIKN